MADGWDRRGREQDVRLGLITPGLNARGPVVQYEVYTTYTYRKREKLECRRAMQSMHFYVRICVQ